MARIHPYLHRLPSRFQREVPPAVIYSLKLHFLSKRPTARWKTNFDKFVYYLKRLKKQTSWVMTGASTNVSSFDPCFESGLGPVSSLEPLFDPAVSLDPLFPTSSLDPLLTKPSSLDPLLDATSSLDPLLIRPGSSFDPFLRGLWFGSSFVSLDPFAPGCLGHWHYVPLMHVYELH